MKKNPTKTLINICTLVVGISSICTIIVHESAADVQNAFSLLAVQTVLFLLSRKLKD